MKRYLLYTIFASIFFIPLFSHAQYIPGGASTGSLADEMTIRVAPEFPKPGQLTRFTLEMYTENLDISDIAWYVDGSLVQSGKGLKVFSTKAPLAGKQKTLRVVVTLSNGVSFQKETSLRPINLDLVWEANSYTPPFYKGKALFPPQGKVKVMAITDLGSLVYTWTVNGDVRQNLSGFNKNSAVINGPILGHSLEIKVEATNPLTGLSAENSIIINPTNPSVVFYENSPLYGVMFNRTLSNISLETEESTVLAVPYNLSRENINNSTYTWRINGIKVKEIAGRSAVFRKPEGVSGRSVVSLEVQNDLKPLQLVKESFSVIFEK